MIQMIFHLMVILNQSFSESVEDRFKAYGWQYLRVEDGNDLSCNC